MGQELQQLGVHAAIHRPWRPWTYDGPPSWPRSRLWAAMEKEAKRIGVRFNSFLGTPANFNVDDKNEILAMEWTSAAGTMLDRLAGSEQPGGGGEERSKTD